MRGAPLLADFARSGTAEDVHACEGMLLLKIEDSGRVNDIISPPTSPKTREKWGTPSNYSTDEKCATRRHKYDRSAKKMPPLSRRHSR
jgi:hypothetical protein